MHSHCPSSPQRGPSELATWAVVPRVGVVGWETLGGQYGIFSIFMRDGEITPDCFYKEIGDWHIYLAQQMRGSNHLVAAIHPILLDFQGNHCVQSGQGSSLGSVVVWTERYR